MPWGLYYGTCISRKKRKSRSKRAIHFRPVRVVANLFLERHRPRRLPGRTRCSTASSRTLGKRNSTGRWKPGTSWSGTTFLHILTKLQTFFQDTSSVEKLALLVARIRDDTHLVDALARFSLQIQTSRLRWFRRLSSDANKRGLAAAIAGMDG